MHVEHIPFKDLNGNDRTMDAYFHLREADVVRMQMDEVGGLDERLKSLMDKQDVPAIMKFFEDFIGMAYGEKDPDGIHFEQSEEITRRFKQTEAYSNLYMKLCFDAEAAANFVNNVMPANLKETLEGYIEKAQKRQEQNVTPTVN